MTSVNRPQKHYSKFTERGACHRIPVLSLNAVVINLQFARRNVLLLCLCLPFGLAYAQQEIDDVVVVDLGEEASPTEDAELSLKAVVIPEIIVTATKQNRALREIPVSISVIDGKALEDSGAQGIADFLQNVPGVNIISQDVGATKVTIRGISSDVGTTSTTGILYGNVSFSDAFFPFVSLDPHPFDMHDVEVLKGPQGTLFGAAALNGAVRYVPNDAELGRFDVKYYAQHMSINEGESDQILGAALNLPLLGDDAALRLVAVQRKTPGYTDDIGRDLKDVNPVDQEAFRVLGSWEPSENWRVDARYVRESSDYPDEGFADNREGRLERGNTPEASPRKSSYDLAAATLEYEFDWATLTSESALVTKRFDQQTDISRTATGANTQQTSLGTTIFFDSETLSQELRLSSLPDAGRWSWVGGLLWSEQPIWSGFDIYLADSVPLGQGLEALGLFDIAGSSELGLLSANGQPLLGQQRSDVTATELAAFGEVNWNFIEDWELTLGLRAYRTRSGGVAVASGALYGGENVNEGEIRETGLNPKVSLSWSPSRDVMFYSLVARGFRLGGIQPTASGLSTDIPKVYKSDTLWSYELGVRSSWFARTLLLDLTVFHVDWDDAVLAQLDANNPNPVAYYYDNVGGARSQGLEAALQWLTPLPRLSINASYSASNTETTVPFTVSSGAEIAPGTKWPFAPGSQSSASLQYNWPIGDRLSLVASYSYNYIADANTTLLGDIQVFDYGLSDVRVRLQDQLGIWPSLSVLVNNVSDVRGINQDTVLGDAHDVSYTRPRTVSLVLSGAF